VIDRDDFVFPEGSDGYSDEGRSESLGALVEAILEAQPGETVHFVACLLTDESRRKVIERVQSESGLDLDVTTTVLDTDVDEVRRVNFERSETERGSIPPEQLEHMIDAWQPPTGSTISIRREG
jgi:hypothetical protein